MLYPVVFGEGDLGRLGIGANGGRVHILEEVIVKALLGPEIGGTRRLGFSQLDNATVCPKQEGAIEKGRCGCDDGSTYGGSSPLVNLLLGGEEVVCDCEKSEGGGDESWPEDGLSLEELVATGEAEQGCERVTRSEESHDEDGEYRLGDFEFGFIGIQAG